MDHDAKPPPVDSFDILFPLEKSVRYHQVRRAFYDGWHRWLMLAIIVAGSASVTDALAGHQKALALLTAIFGAMDLVFALSDRARDHEFLMRRFAALMAGIRRNASPTPSDLEGWRAERVEIESDEPAIYWALEAVCYNEVARAFDRDRSAEVYVPWHYRVFRNYLRFEPTRFKSLGELAAQTRSV